MAESEISTIEPVERPRYVTRKLSLPKRPGYVGGKRSLEECQLANGKQDLILCNIVL